MEMFVGDKWWLLLGDQQILWGKNEFPDQLMTVFQEEDKYMREEWARSIDEANTAPYGPPKTPEPPGLDDRGYFDEDDDEVEDDYDRDAAELFGYRTTVGTALARLRLMGFTPEASRQSMAEIRRGLIKRDGGEDVLYARLAPGVQAERHEMSSEEVVSAGLAAHLKRCTTSGWAGLDLVERACLDELEFHFEDASEDSRYLLSALLHGQDPQTTLTIDLHDLLEADYCCSADELSDQALQQLRDVTANTGPIIVITEGRFDSRVLPRALRLVRPDLAGYFKFWDLETTKAAGGTDQVVKNLRSFAAAGVMNRVIGILDNDTAGRQAEKLLASAPLPDHYGVCRLPDLDYANSYPTLGPSGASEENIAGRACSVEFYFGMECLRGPDGNLVPVRWKSHIEGMADYQGELVNKAYVQSRIEELLKQAESSDKPLGDNWNPMRQLAQRLIELAEPEIFD
ncbi:HEPN/Toprim-associated domain-containing protein [Streptomyces sp. NPDC054958]